MLDMRCFDDVFFFFPTEFFFFLIAERRDKNKSHVIIETLD